ncbi:MAG: electron transfer flavoprotein subunit alpha/FixB family protein, partial [Bacteroidia bacterium]|nr:electron transfer flavoprotein subunit alpha/FixB family protein [Bacteroidia bacterium]
MSVLVYTESDNGQFKKAALEVASYANAIASQMNTTVTAVTFNARDASVLGKYGVNKVLNISNVSQ